MNKMNRILRYDWLPERARWRQLAGLGLPAVSGNKIVFFSPLNDSFIDQVFFCQDGWIYLHSFFFLRV